MRTLSVIVAFFIAVPLASGTFQPTREVDFWRSTGFDLAQAKQFISTTVCYATPELFQACVEAFLQAGSMLHTNEFAALEIAVYDHGPRTDFDALLQRVDRLAVANRARRPIEMVYGSMVNAELHRFDAHAKLAPGDYLNTIYASPVKELAEIGAEEEINGAGLFIRRIYPQSPAESSGLQVNDRIVTIQGEAVKPGLKALKAMRHLSQPAGASVVLKVERAGQTLNISMQVAHLTLDDVLLDFDQFGKTTYAHFTIRSFSHGVCTMLRTRLSLVSSQVQGVVLDVRGNLGGALEEAACVMSLFSKQRTFVEKRPTTPLIPSQLGLVQNFSSTDQESWRQGFVTTLFGELPLVVLVNSSSASASEMLAASLQDHARAWIVGEPTFGKGSTQAVVGEPCNPNLRLVYTVSRYYRPNGAPLQLIGVTPNFIVSFQKSATALEREFPREAELYGTKLDREPAAPWKETRVREAARLRECLAHSRMPDWFSTQQIKASGFEDYQKSYAYAILRCSPAGP